MIRLFKAELRKIFLRPGIFVMTALLAVILALSYFLYQPMTRNTSEISIDRNQVSEIYDYFKNGNMSYSKSDALSYMTSTNNLIENYRNNNTISNVETLKTQVNTLNDNIYAFLDRVGRVISSPSGEGKEIAYKILTETLKPSVDSLVNLFSSLIDTSNPLILVNKNTAENITLSLNSINRILTTTSEPTQETYKNMQDNLNLYNISTDANKYTLNITPDIESIVDVKFDEEFLNTLQADYYNVGMERLAVVEQDIDDFYASIGGNYEFENSVEKKAELNELISFYYNTCRQLNEIVISKVYLKIAESYSDYEFAQLYGLENFIRYESEQSLTRQEYLFDHNKMEYDYAVPFNFTSTSNFETNTYDFMYFVLELFSFIIIIYCVVMGSSMIAGEQNNGTLKLLAIRPYKRWTIMTSKILATMFFAFVFTLLAMIITFIAGGFMFGFESAPILCIFNATTAFEISPILLTLIYFLTLLLKIGTYILLAFTISTIFRSYVGAVTVSIFCFFATAILNLFVSSNSIIKYLPLNNLDLFKYMGGGSFTANSSIFNIFSSPILPDMSFVFSLINILLTISILAVITYTVFKNRNIA